MNDLLLSVSLMCLLILLLIFILKKLRQPYLVAYILAGILIGPYTTKIFTNVEDVAGVGEVGILLLMFFLGMEIDIPDRRSLLYKPLVAQGMRMILSLGLVTMLGLLTKLSLIGIVMITILFTFNSTAVVSEYLRKNGEIHTDFGKAVLNILLLQDILLAPVLTLFQFVGNTNIPIARLITSVVCCVLIFFLIRAIRNRNFLQPKLHKIMEDDHELQVFAGCVICLGFGVLAELAGLSGAVGSFIAGILIGRIEAFHWLEKALKPFKVFFVAFFFVSVGLRLDIPYIANNYTFIISGTLIILLVNSLLSAVVFRCLKYRWRDSLYGAALLSQTGEFGILAFSLAYNMNIIPEGFLKIGIAITALSLLFSTVWITILKKMVSGRVHYNMVRKLQ